MSFWVLGRFRVKPGFWISNNCAFHVAQLRKLMGCLGIFLRAFTHNAVRQGGSLGKLANLLRWDMSLVI